MHFDRERLPTIEVRGQVVRSTAGRLHELLQQHAPAVTLPACYDALLASWREADPPGATSRPRSRLVSIDVPGVASAIGKTARYWLSECW